MDDDGNPADLWRVDYVEGSSLEGEWETLDIGQLKESLVSEDNNGKCAGSKEDDDSKTTTKKRKKKSPSFAIDKPAFRGKALVLSSGRLIGYAPFKSAIRKGSLPASFCCVSQSDYFLMRGTLLNFRFLPSLILLQSLWLWVLTRFNYFHGFLVRPTQGNDPWTSGRTRGGRHSWQGSRRRKRF